MDRGLRYGTREVRVTVLLLLLLMSLLRMKEIQCRDMALVHVYDVTTTVLLLQMVVMLLRMMVVKVRL